MSLDKRINVAIVTSYGLDKGGTEKFLQNIAALLPKDRYTVDYYYIDNDLSRVSDIKKEFLIKNNVNLIQYQVERIVSRYRCIFQKKSTFFDVYKDNYDVIITGSCGLAEDPLIKIKDTPILQSIHYVSGADNQYNISRVLHISKFSRQMWINKGGDDSRSVMISHPIIIPSYKKINFREKFGIKTNSVVFGLHQRNNDYIFSPIPLEAYSRIETDNTAFILCGGSDKYRDQARELNLKKCYFIPATDDPDVLYSFLESIDVYTHGRYDGELNSTALAEAMFYKLPIVTHTSKVYNGHLEVIDGNGVVCNNLDEYVSALESLKNNKELRKSMGDISFEKFAEKYNESAQINNIEQIIADVLNNPYQGRKFNFFRDEIKRTLRIECLRVIAFIQF